MNDLFDKELQRKTGELIKVFTWRQIAMLVRDILSLVVFIAAIIIVITKGIRLAEQLKILLK